MEEYAIQYSNLSMPAFEFLGKNYTDLEQLVLAFIHNWDEGKSKLFSGELVTHLREYDADLARKCQAAEENVRDSGGEDVVFWQLMYQLNPHIEGFVWLGQAYESLISLGNDIIERLWNSDDSQYDYYSSILSSRVLSKYVLMINPDDYGLKETVERIEKYYDQEMNRMTDMKRSYYYMAYMLSGQRILLLNGEYIRTVGEFANYMKRVLADSYDRFDSLCHRLVDYEGNLDCQLEAWLMANNKQAELDKWRESLNV